jgi:hypothetical protein
MSNTKRNDLPLGSTLFIDMVKHSRYEVTNIPIYFPHPFHPPKI